MIGGMDEHKVNNFYKTYKWFDQLFKDIHGLLTVISNRYKVKVSDLYYQTKSKGPPLLPDPYYCAFKLKEIPGWKLSLVSVLCPDKASEFENEELKNIIKEPAVVVIVNRRNPKPKSKENLHYDANYILRRRNIAEFRINDTSFSGLYADNGDFKGFVVPLYEFSRQKLEERAKEENIGLEQALNKTIEELIVNPLNKLLGL